MKKSLTVTALALAVALFAPRADLRGLNHQLRVHHRELRGQVRRSLRDSDVDDVTGGVQFDITLDTNLFMILDAFGFSSSVLNQELLDIDSPYGGWMIGALPAEPDVSQASKPPTYSVNSG